GLLLIEIAERCGAEVVPVKAEWGRVIEPEAIEAALQGGRTRLVALVQGETSTGVLQPLEDIARLCRHHVALLLADAVVTRSGSRCSARSRPRTGCRCSRRSSCPTASTSCASGRRCYRTSASRSARPSARCRAGSGESGRWGPLRRGATSCSASPRSTRCF